MSTKTLTRTTKTKSKVEEVFKLTHEPLTLQELFEKVVDCLPKTAYSTIFRIVERFEACGLITKVDWKDRGGVYEWAARPHHHHIVCEKCNSVEDIDDSVLGYDEKNVKKKTGFIITHHSLEFMGICKPCQKKK